MQKITMRYSRNVSTDKAFLDFQRYNTAKNLSPHTINSYDDCYKYFRKLFWYKTAGGVNYKDCIWKLYYISSNKYKREWPNNILIL